jgi:hypothetical protein
MRLDYSPRLSGVLPDTFAGRINGVYACPTLWRSVSICVAGNLRKVGQGKAMGGH